MEHLVSTYGRIPATAGGEDTLVARTEVWQPAQEWEAGAVRFPAAGPGLWRLAAVVGDIPDGAAPITSVEHTEAVVRRRIAAEQAAAAEVEAVVQQRRTDYEALLGVGLPIAAATRLSGFNPNPAPKG